MQASEQNVQAFEAWMQQVGIKHSSSMELKIEQGVCAGWGVRSTKPIKDREKLVWIPKSAILSTRNTTIADILLKERLGGGLGLIVAVMAEAGLQGSSKWHGYLRSLPAEGESVPLLWRSPNALKLLQGTELEGKVEEHMADTQSDFEEHVAPLADRYPTRIPRTNGAWSLQAFRKAASWVASRAFYVDKVHKDAMVPLADVFNHKASVVGDEYAVIEEEQSDSSSEEEEVEIVEVDEDEEEREEVEEEHGRTHHHHSGHHHHHRSQSPSPGLEPQGSDGHKQEGAGQEEQKAPPKPLSGSFVKDGVDLQLQITISSVVEDGVDTLQMIAAKDLPAGVEIWSTYGELGNTELMAKYGFYIPRNPFSEINLREVDLGTAAAAALGRRLAAAAGASMSSQPKDGAGGGRAQQQRGGGKGRRGGNSSSKRVAHEPVDKALLRRHQFLDATSSLLTPPPQPKPRSSRRPKRNPTPEDHEGEEAEQQPTEPLCVLPGGCVNLPVYLVLRVLTSTEEELNGWSCVEDVLKNEAAGDGEAGGKGLKAEMPQQQQRQQEVEGAGQADRQPNQGQDIGKEEAEALHPAVVERFSHAVQVPWGPRSGKQQQGDAAACAGGSQPAAERKSCAQGASAAAHAEDAASAATPYGEECVRSQQHGTCYVWTRSMVDALAAAVRSRLARYGGHKGMAGLQQKDGGADGGAAGALHSPACSSETAAAKGKRKRSRDGRSEGTVVQDEGGQGSGVGGGKREGEGAGCDTGGDGRKRKKYGGDGAKGSKQEEQGKSSQPQADTGKGGEGEEEREEGAGDGNMREQNEVCAAKGLREDECLALQEVLQRLESWGS